LLDEGDDLRRLAGQQPTHPGTERRRMAVGPGGLDQESPGVAVPGLGDVAAPFLEATGALARDETDERHELAGVLEAAEVLQFSQQGDRAELGDPAQAGGALRGPAVR